MGLWVAPKGRQKKRAGRGAIAGLGLRELQDCSSRVKGWGQVKRVSHTLKDCWLGVPPPQRVPEGCQILSGHFLWFKEAFILTKGET